MAVSTTQLSRFVLALRLLPELHTLLDPENIVQIFKEHSPNEDIGYLTGALAGCGGAPAALYVPWSAMLMDAPRSAENGLHTLAKEYFANIGLPSRRVRDHMATRLVEKTFVTVDKHAPAVFV